MKKIIALFVLIIFNLNFVPLSFADEREDNIEKFKQNYQVIFCEENYCVLSAGKPFEYAIANPNDGKILTPFMYSQVSSLSPAYALKVKYAGNYAIYDLNTNKQTKFEYEDVRVNQKNGKYFFEYKYDGKWRKMRGVRLKKAKDTVAWVAMSPLLIITAPIWGLYLFGFYKCFISP